VVYTSEIVTNLEIRRKPNKREAIHGMIANHPRGAANSRTARARKQTRKIERGNCMAFCPFDVLNMGASYRRGF
jgi:hypothetical protein